LAAIDSDRAIALLQELVRTPTVNPPGEITATVELCAAELSAAGFAVRTVEVEPGKPNLIAELGSGEGPVLCFNSHLDVVPVGDVSAWTHDPFGGAIDAGRVWGRGALDDKASVVAQVMAALALARSEMALRGRLIVNLVADEEIGGPAGAAHIVESKAIVPDFVIVGEPTLNRVCIGERGGGNVRIEVVGRTAHGALPWEGINAIEAMGIVIAALRTELWPKLEERTHPYFHHSSASINGISGGVKDNVVPDRCAITIDRRFVPGEDPVECLREIDDVVHRAVAAVPGATANVAYSGEVNRARMSDPESPLVRAMVDANRAIGLDERLTGFSMATDGRFFAAAGYPTIIFGPGDPRLAHVPDESVGIVELLAATRAYALAAVNLFAT
jgi:succinyl-diaminopimelate desuccinylase